MATLEPRHVTMTIDDDGSTWSYEDLAINEDSAGFNSPKFIIFSNLSTTDNMYVKWTNKNDGDGSETSDIGIFLKAGGQLQISTVGWVYRVGARMASAGGSGNQTLEVSYFSYGYTTL